MIFSQNSAQKTAQKKAQKICCKRNDDGLCKIFFAAREIDGGDVEHRFARTVGDAGAARDIAVRAVFGEQFGEKCRRPASRKGFQKDELSDFGRDAEEGEDGRERADEGGG